MLSAPSTSTALSVFVFEKDFAAMESLFTDKEFVEELKAFDVSKLSEEEKKIVEVVRSQYEQYLAKAIAKYEE